MANTFFYPVYLTIVFSLTLIFIPKKEYKEYLIYGFVCGGLADILVVGIFANILHFMWFKSGGIFFVMGQIFLSPPCWTLTMMLFLYFLPKRRPFLYLYTLTFTIYSFGYGLMVRNCGLYDFRPWFYYGISPFLFLIWWSFGAWLFIKTSPFAKKSSW